MFTGCYDKLFDLIMNNEFVISFITVLMLFQAGMIFFTLWIICTMGNKIDIV